MKVDVSILDRQLNLPSPPIVVQKLNECMSDSNVPYHELANIIETDQAFTAKILRLVNSPFYGFAGKITSVEEAITMLGMNTIHQLLLTTSMLNSIKVQNKALDLNQFWLHSFGVGVIAKNLLSKQKSEIRNEGFLGGILHDIGRLIFVKIDPLRFEKLYTSRENAIPLKLESDYFSIDHQKLGEALSQKWNFPENITESIAYHHSPNDAPSHILHASAVNIADILCHALEIGDSGSYYVTEFFSEAWDRLEITYDELEIYLKKAVEEIDNSSAMLKDMGK